MTAGTERPTARHFVKRESKLEVYIRSLPSEIWKPQENRERKDCRSQRGWSIPGEHGPTNQLDSVHIGSRWLKQLAQGQHAICTKFSVYTLWLSAWCFCEIPKSGSRFIADSFVWSWDSFPPIGLPSLASIWVLLPCLIISCFVLFGCLFSEEET